MYLLLTISEILGGGGIKPQYLKLNTIPQSEYTEVVHNLNRKRSKGDPDMVQEGEANLSFHQGFKTEQMVCSWMCIAQKLLGK